MQEIGRVVEPGIRLHEGLAQDAEERPVNTRVLAAKIMAAGGPIALAKLEGSFLQLPRSDAELAYAESLLAVQYLKERYGPFAIRELLKFLSEGDNIGTAIARLTARDYAEFNAEFQTYVQDQGEPLESQ